MKLQCSRFSALIAVMVCVLSGCASAPKIGVEMQADQVKIYGPSQIVRGQYDDVRYLWVDSWRTAFSLPTASSEAEGIASLQTEAARLGANGLMNVSCRDQGQYRWPWSRNASILCNGHAIRVH